MLCGGQVTGRGDLGMGGTLVCERDLNDGGREKPEHHPGDRAALCPA